ncbi:MAG: mechanosensitive ion channel family protein [Acutalibacteraceae bacterium]
MEETTLAPITLEEATGFLDKLLDKIYDFAITYGFRLLFAALLLFLGFKLTNFIVKLYKKSKLYERLDPTVRSFLKSAISIGLKLLVVVSAAAILGVPMSSMVALVTSAGLTIGLALQGGLSNIAGGFVILVFKPFSVGDFIAFGEYSGTVKSISLFYTKIITVDQRQIVIPNSMVSNNVLIDNSALPTRRVDLTFCVGYDSDMDAVRRIILRTADHDPDVLKDPAPVVLLEKQDSSSLNFQCRTYCPSDKYWDVYFRLNENVKRAFDENGISIPYPQMDVHLHSASGGDAK